MKKGLIILCLFHFTANLVFFSLNTAPLPWDQAGHTRLAMEFTNFFKDLGFINIFQTLSVSTYYPPLLHIIGGFLILIFGHPLFVASLLINFSFILLLVLLYIYTSDLFGDKLVGLLVSLIFSFLPIVFEHSRWFLLEIPQLALFLAALICLNRGKSFTRAEYIYGFFFFAALGLLTKWLILIYLAVPFLFTLYRWQQLNKYIKTDTLRYITEGFVIFLVISLPWYLINFNQIISQAKINVLPEASDPQDLLSLKNFVHYFYLFINFQLTFYPALLFLGGLGIFIFKRHPFRVELLSTLGFIYLIFTLIPNKDWRYTFPFVVYATIVIGFALVQIRQWRKFLGQSLILVVTGHLVVLYFLLSFQFPLNIPYQKAFYIPVLGWIDYINTSDSLAHFANRDNWYQKEILTGISNDAQGEKTEVLSLIDKERLNPSNLLLSRDLMGFNNINIYLPTNQSLDTDLEISQFLSLFNYLIISEPSIISVSPATRNPAAFTQLSRYLQNQTFIQSQKIQSFLLPDGSSAALIKLK